MHTLTLGLGCAAVLGWTALAHGADPTTGKVEARTADGKVVAATTFRASKLIGLNVRNHNNEKLGTVEDFVVNVDNGKVNYAALGVGGLFGLGEKMFAIPFNAMTFVHDKNEMHFVINMSKEKLQAAPGFDKNNWPDFADPNWAQQIENYYQASETKTKATENRPATTTAPATNR